MSNFLISCPLRISQVTTTLSPLTVQPWHNRDANDIRAHLIMPKQRTNVGVKYNYTRFCTGPQNRAAMWVYSQRSITRQRSIDINPSGPDFDVANTASCPCLLYQIFLSEQSVLQRYSGMKGSLVIFYNAISWFLSPIQSYMVITPFCIKLLRNFCFYSPLVRVGLRLCGISASNGSTVHLPGDTNEYESSRNDNW
jgi:hypothetical protein